MRPFSFSVCFAFVAQALLGFASPLLETRANEIDQTTYNNLERFTKFSSAAYQFLGCPRPVGATMVKSFDASGTQGLVARDDGRKEIVVAFRGSFSPTDFVVDAQVIMIPLKSTGLTNVGNAYAHTGFQYAYNAVASDILSIVKAQIADQPTYSIVVTGHSLGGAVASIASLSLKAALPSTPLKLYTFGQPRVGNAEFASLVEQRIGTTNIFRAVHTYDGVPTILLKSLGYRHFGTEYWNFEDPANKDNVKKCTGGDDPSCSDSIPSTFINPAHLSYFGQAMALNPLLCL